MVWISDFKNDDQIRQFAIKPQNASKKGDSKSKKTQIWSNVIWSIFPWLDQAESISCFRNSLPLSCVSGDLLIPFRPPICPRNCGRAAHQNVEVVLSNHGLPIFLPDCLQKKSRFGSLVGDSNQNLTSTRISGFKKKCFRGNMGRSRAGCSIGGSKRLTLYLCDF